MKVPIICLPLLITMLIFFSCSAPKECGDQRAGDTAVGSKASATSSFLERGNLLNFFNNQPTSKTQIDHQSDNSPIDQKNSQKAIDLEKKDSFGAILTITAMLIVFAALFALYIFFKFSGNIATKLSKRNIAKSGTLSAARSYSHLSGEVLAAISAAIYEIKENQHDIESTILTIQQVKRNYSPWSSKSQSLRSLPK